MNGDSLSLSAPRFIVGNWDRLTAQQQRVFITYVTANFGGEIGNDPPAFARKLWNDSVAAANSSSPPGSDRLLNLSRLATFIGVTSMWETRGVIEQVTIVTNINGEQPHQNFRLYGELVDGGGQRIKDAFKYKIPGSGHGDYKVSRRERNFFREPNGQFSMTNDLRLFDSDVDYRSLWDSGHNTPENSDIRAFDGGTSHLKRHKGRYGEVPITMQDILLAPSPMEMVFSDNEIAIEADAEFEALNQAKTVSDAFAERFSVTLTLDGLFEEMFAPGAIAYIKRTGFFVGAGLDEEFVDSLSEADLVRIYKQAMDFYYLHNLFTLRTEFLGAVALGERSQELPSEVGDALRSTPQLRTLAGDDEAEDREVDTIVELEQYLASLSLSADSYRERLRAGEGRPELFRANIRSIHAQRDRPFRMETSEDESPNGETRDIYIIEQGVFIVRMVKDGNAVKIINLGVGN